METRREFDPDPLKYEGLVRHVARQFREMSGDLGWDDLLQSGRLGLVIACNRYDLSKGCEVSTYAYRWIKTAIQREITSGGRPIRLPDFLVDGRKNVCETSRVRLESFRKHSYEHEDVADKVSDGRSPCDESLELEEDLERLGHAMGRIGGEERYVITRLFGLDGKPPSTLMGVASELGIGRAKIRSIHRRAMARLRYLLSDRSPA